MADEETYDFDPWETSSGLPDNLTVRIDNPHFAFDAEIQNGNVCLFKPEGMVLSGDGVDEPTDFNQFFGCGPGWEPAGKGGTRVVREDGKAKKFNNNVAYAHLFTSLLKAAQKQGVDDKLRKRGTPYDASLWSGLVVDLHRTQLPSFKDKTTGENVERSVLMVTNIVKMGDTAVTAASDDAGDGDADVEKASVSSNSDDTANTAATTMTAPPATASSNGLDPKIKAKLRVAARNADSHAQFVETAFDIEGVLDDPAAEQAVMDDGEGSIYASVKAEA